MDDPRAERRMIEAHGLARSYAGVPVLDDVSFTLERGSRTALVGANGAGKSTLLGLLTGLVQPSAGEARIGGYRVDDARARRQIGVLSHLPMLYEELSPLENLRFFGRLYDVHGAAARIEELLRAVGLWRRRHEQTAVLSRGFHQRLAIARALLHRPPVLLLDEPETGLDVEGLELLDELMLLAPDVTVLAATHRTERVERWADARLVVERGGVRGPEPVGGDVPTLVASKAG